MASRGPASRPRIRSHVRRTAPRRAERTAALPGVIAQRSAGGSERRIGPPIGFKGDARAPRNFELSAVGLAWDTLVRLCERRQEEPSPLRHSRGKQSREKHEDRGIWEAQSCAVARSRPLWTRGRALGQCCNAGRRDVHAAHGWRRRISPLFSRGRREASTPCPPRALSPRGAIDRAVPS